MKKIKFKKIASVLGSMALVGVSMGGVIATSYPSSFQNSDGVALVYGSNSAPTDLVATNNLNTNLVSYMDSLNQITISNETSFITENEVVLGKSIWDNNKLRPIIKDNKLSSLYNGKVYWDNGVDSKTSYNVHEEIDLGNMTLITTLDDNDLNGTALTNNKDLEYKYVFDDNLNTSLIGTDDSDTLKITLLGKEYEIKSMDDSSITVSQGDEKIVKANDQISFENITLTVDEIFDNSISVNGVIINEGKTKKVNGVEVYAENVMYHTSSELPTKAIIKVGKDLSKSIYDGDAYNSSEDEPTWVWDIQNPGQKDGYIGVKYDKRQQNSDDDLVYAGQSYNFPEDFATVAFKGLTNAVYDKFDLSFDDSVDLYLNANGNNKTYKNAKVVTIKGPEDDSFKIGNVETNQIYLKWNGDGNVTIDNGIINQTISQTTFEVYANDVAKDYSDSIKPRLVANVTVNTTDGSITDIGTLSSGDIELGITTNFTNESRTLNIGNLSVTLNSNGDFEYLGSDKEDSESKDVLLEGKQIGTKDNNDILSHNGILVKDVNSNANADQVRFEVPEEDVYGKIVVSNAVSTTTIPASFNTVIVKDTEISSVMDRNLIIVGGSCINKAAAKLLGVPESTCGVDFTTATGIGTGQYLVKEYTSPYNSNKTAFLVAGFEAIDTTNAVNSIASTV